ncbi:MAG: FRG domain-containing protein [Chryseolinea sp.]
MKTIINLFEKKGWALYEVTEDTNNDLEKIILTGKTKSLEPNKYYTILPLVSKNNDVDEIIDHLEIAKKTNQQPKYKGGEQTFILDGFEIVNELFYLHPSHTTDFYVKVDKTNIESTIQYAISNYNTYFFSSVDELLKVVSISPQQDPILPKQLRWELVHKDSSNLNIIYPSDPNPIFFRGQNARYQPCHPSISRNISTRNSILKNLTLGEQILVSVRMIKTEWFCKLLEETPHHKWYKEQKIWMDRMALAQHYELPTGLIDLTQSIDVATFFACCKYEEDGSWSPMKSGEGIIYSLDARLIPIGSRKVRAIGQQAFPRPSEQWGWAFEMNLNEDFDLLPYVRKYIFLHNEESSKKILKKYSLGKDLFPNDPLFNLANKIKISERLPSRVVNEVLDDLISDEKGLMGVSKDDLIKEISLHYQIKDEVKIIDKDLVDELKHSWENRKNDFWNSIGGMGFRMVRTRK